MTAVRPIDEAAPAVEPSPELRVVRGPSALGGGWRRLLDLVLLLAFTDFKRTYFGTALGYVWSIGRPLATFAVLLTVFTQVFRIGSDVPNYPVLLLFNIVLMGFFTEATTTAVTSVVSREAIVRKTQFPRLAIPLSVVVTALMNLGLNLVVVLVFALAFGVHPEWTWLLLPVAVAGLALLTLAVSMVLSSLYPRFRDIAIIWTVASTALFYGTPVLYPIERAPEAISSVLLINPITPILQVARQWVIDPTAPSLGDIAGSVPLMLAPAGVLVGICALGVLVFRREAPRIAEQL